MFTFWLVILLSTDHGVIFGIVDTYDTMTECQASLKKLPPSEYTKHAGCLAVVQGVVKET